MYARDTWWPKQTPECDNERSGALITKEEPERVDVRSGALLSFFLRSWKIFHNHPVLLFSVGLNAARNWNVLRVTGTNQQVRDTTIDVSLQNVGLQGYSMCSCSQTMWLLRHESQLPAPTRFCCCAATGQRPQGQATSIAFCPLPAAVGQGTWSKSTPNFPRKIRAQESLGWSEAQVKCSARPIWFEIHCALYMF